MRLQLQIIIINIKINGFYKKSKPARKKKQGDPV